MFNEPHSGYIGIPSLNEFDFNTDLHLSHVRESIASNFADHTRYQYLFFSTIQHLLSNHSNWELDIQPWYQHGHVHTLCQLSVPPIHSLILQRPRPGAQMVLHKADVSGNTMMSGVGTPCPIKLSSFVKTTFLDILILGRK